MRTVIYGAACSLDGYITCADGAMDWLYFIKDVETVMAETWARVDTILMGRKTYEVAAAMGGGGGGMAGIEAYVFSRTLRSVAPPGHLVTTDAADFVRDLKAGTGKDICVMGGSNLARSLFAAGVIDEVGLNIHPVLLGAGVPFFLDAGRIPLELRESRSISGGCVLLTYQVRRAGAARARRSSGRKR